MKVNIKYDTGLNIYVGHEPILNIWSQGSTIEEARKATEDAVNCYKKVMEEKGIFRGKE
jgi:predicted RNase H-like HicB family nuclease